MMKESLSAKDMVEAEQWIQALFIESRSSLPCSAEHAQVHEYTMTDHYTESTHLAQTPQYGHAVLLR